MMTTASLVVLLAGPILFGGSKNEDKAKTSPLDQYIQEVSGRGTQAESSTSGSIFSPNARLLDLPLDLRARRVDDIVTVIVEERASAVSRGTVSSSRDSSAKAGVEALLGGPKIGALPNLLGLSSNQSLDGAGETTRESVLSTTVAARVTHVLPNGNLVVQGTKSVTVNAETQVVAIRGIVRPYDIDPSNSVLSGQIAQMEVVVNGKGVVADVVRRPNFLYRLLLGILPF